MHMRSFTVTHSEKLRLPLLVRQVSPLLPFLGVTFESPTEAQYLHCTLLTHPIISRQLTCLNLPKKNKKAPTLNAHAHMANCSFFLVIVISQCVLNFSSEIVD
eukprot:UN01762